MIQQAIVKFAIICLFSMVHPAASSAEFVRHDIHISGGILSIDLAGGNSKDFYDLRIPAAVDLYDDRSYGADNTILLVMQHRDYKKYWRVMGTLAITVYIKRTPPNARLLLDDQFRRYLSQVQVQNSRKLAAIGHVNASCDTLEVRPALLNGVTWQRFCDVDGQEQFAYALTDLHYLVVSISYIENSVGQNSGWRERAAIEVSKTLSSLIIQRK